MAAVACGVPSKSDQFSSDSGICFALRLSCGILLEHLLECISFYAHSVFAPRDVCVLCAASAAASCFLDLPPHACPRTRNSISFCSMNIELDAFVSSRQSTFACSLRNQDGERDHLHHDQARR